MGTPRTARDSVVQIAVEDLPRYLSTLEAQLDGGRSIELVRGDRVVAELRGRSPEHPHTEARQQTLPDFMARLKRIYGGEVLPAGTTTRWIRDDRDGL